MRHVPPQLPRFASEEEEARWYAEHPEFFTEMTRKAVAEGRFKLTKKTPAERLAMARQVREEAAQKAISANITLRMSRFEIDRAKRQAAQKGMRYQTYIKMLLHDALEREETRR